MYGLKLQDTVYLATLVDLPCIIEAMKTLDFTNFFKSQDASQMLYVHSKKIDNFTDKSLQEINKIVYDFDPIKEDPEFFKNLYQRKRLTELHQKSQKKAEIDQKESNDKDELMEEEEDHDKMRELFGSDKDDESEKLNKS